MLFYPLDLFGDQTRKAEVVVFLADRIDWVVPVVVWRSVAFRNKRPKIDPTRHLAFEGAMEYRTVKPSGALAAENQIDQRQDGRRRTERMLHRQSIKPLSDRAQSAAEMFLHLVKAIRIGALKGIDRLLLVAHDKDRPALVGRRAFACGKLLRQKADHLPLRRARVLRLVDEDVINPSIELEQDPCSHARIGQELVRLVDQIVEIKLAAGEFVFFVKRQEKRREIMKGQRPLERCRGEKVIVGLCGAVHPAVQILDHGGKRRYSGAMVRLRKVARFRAVVG